MKLKYYGKTYTYFLVDDGTLDTVIEIEGIEHRLSSDAIRRHQTGRLMFEPYLTDMKFWVKEIIESDSRYWNKSNR